MATQTVPVILHAPEGFPGGDFVVQVLKGMMPSLIRDRSVEAGEHGSHAFTAKGRARFAEAFESDDDADDVYDPQVWDHDETIHWLMQIERKLTLLAAMITAFAVIWGRISSSPSLQARSSSKSQVPRGWPRVDLLRPLRGVRRIQGEISVRNHVFDSEVRTSLNWMP